MKVLVLGGSGFIGREIVGVLLAQGHSVMAASRRPQAHGSAAVRVLDVLHEPSLVQALAGVDAVVNATTGNGAVIAQGASALSRALQQAGVRHLVHLSSQAVYGAQEGRLSEDTPLQATLGWYGQAKIAAEQAVQAWVGQGGGRAAVLRPGCVTGPGSPLWETRLVQWLKWGHLGDLGAAGDGWSNLVAVRDVALAVAAALQRLPEQTAACEVYNLAALDAPRWNQAFADLALSVGAVPLRRIGPAQLWLQSRCLGLPLKLAERLAARVGYSPQALPPGMPPSLLGVFRQQIQLVSLKAHQTLGLALQYPSPQVQRPTSHSSETTRATPHH